MIHEVGNVELCELLETEPKTQCKVSLSYWDVGIVYCTCGHFLQDGTEENKKFVKYTLDLLSIPNYYIKKGRPHGHRFGKKPGEKGDHQYCTDISGTIVYLRALQGHSRRSLIDPSLQDNVIIQSEFFHYIYHIGCAFNLHSIINSGLISGGQNSSKRQTVFFLPVDPRDKGQQDHAKIDFNEPRRAQYLHSAWKKHQDAVFWVDIDLAI